MTTEVEITDALMGHLTSPALTDPATPISYPFVVPKYKPAGIAYLDVRPILRAPPDQPDLAYDSEITKGGIFQIDAVAPATAGEAEGVTLAELVAERFAAGTAIDLTGARLRIENPPVIAAVIEDGSWIRYPVSITYVC